MRDHVTQKQEVDFTGAVIRTTVTAYNGPFLKPSSVNVYAGSNTGATPVSSTLYTYDEYTASYCKNGVPMMASFNGAYGHDDTDFGTGITRGNVTTIQRLISGTTYATTHNCYDTLGNVTQTVDANGNPTSYSYTENWADTDCFPSGTITHAFPTTITDALGHSTKASYFTCTILRQSIADQNQINAGLTSTYTYDKLERPLTITYPDGGITTDCYSQNPGSSCYTSTLPPFTTESRLITGTSYLTTKTLLDSYNRVGETQLTSDPDCTSNDKTDTTYDAFGRVLSVSNPYCTTSDPTYGVTTSAYDALARVTAVTAQDGSVTATSYSGNTTTITDPAGVSRKYVVDALDRVTQIFENPISLNYETDYAYDALNDLLTVTQKGGSTTSTNWRTRTFIYDGLSRLTQASNPESGTAAYSYDANGNLVTKTSPAQNQTGTATVTLTYCYDALNRLSGKAYTAQSCPLSSPVASYTYDQTSSNGLTVTNGIGRRTGMTDPIGSEAWSYDSMGRPLADLRYYSAIRRGCSSYTRTTSYSYNLDGSVKTLTYPSGPTYTYAYSSAARPISVSDQLGVSYANRAAYSPSGAVSSLTNVSGLVSSFYYNSRLQPCRISATSSGAAPSSCANMANIGNVVDYTYNFSLGTADNGNVTSITNNRDNTRSQNFTYDALNRLATAQTQTTGVTIPNSNCWGFTFGYDAWGNLLSGMTTGPAGCSEPMPLNVSATTSNQVVGYCYDSAGNLLDQGSCPTSGSHTYSYNAENQMTGLSGSVYYKYDGDGKRVYKAPGGDILYWYGVGSGALDEMYSCTGTSAGEYVFFAGKRIAFLDSSGNTDYYFADHLGSSRVVTNSSGSILDDSDFYPFGGERPITSSSGNSYKFTGKERDAESGLDNFGARYNSSNLGRFMSPDPEGILSARTTSPQSWNFYSYVQNNPVNAVDPEGLDCVYIGDNSASVKRGDCVSDTDNGIFVNGTIDTTSGTYNSSTGTLGFNYTNDDTGAIGSGVIGNVYPSGGVSDQDRLNALGLAGQIAAPGVNLAANGLRAFGYVVAAPLMVAAECGAGADSCTKGNVAMALVPELGPILEGANLLKISKVIQYERVGGFAQATKDFEALQGAERTIGNVKVKDLADGSKAVLRNFSSEGRPTLEIQNQVGKDIKIRYN
jgi:RHS repeat-associated protein